MSEVWPPPPENQPQIVVPATSLRHSLAAIISSGLLYSCLGALMLFFVVVLAFVGDRLPNVRRTPEDLLFLGALALFSLTFVIVGGCLGYAARRTANGLAALIVSAAALCLSFGLVLMRSL